MDVADDTSPEDAPQEQPADRRPRPYRVPDDAPSPERSEDAPQRRPGGTPLLVSLVMLAAGLAVLVAGLVVYLTAGSSQGRLAQVRDSVLLDARQDIVVLNTLDYRSVDAGLKRWSAASTGTLHQSLVHVGPATRQHIVSARKITTAKVLDAAVVSLDRNAGTATVIAAVQLRVASPGGAATIKRERLRAEMARVGGTWKVSSLGQVGVTLG